MNELKLPELGENIEVAEISAVLVAVGDQIREEQPVIEVETEKASLEVPTTFSGRVTELRVKAGDKIKVGQVILVTESVAGDAPTPGPEKLPTPEQPPPQQREAARAAGRSGADRRDGPREKKAPRRKAGSGRKRTKAASSKPRSVEPSERDEPSRSRPQGPSVVAFPDGAKAARPEIGDAVPAAPSVRALAREIGVVVRDVQGSGPGGRITRDDVKAHAKSLLQARTAPAGPGAPAAELPDFTRWGEVERQPLGRIRRLTADAMATAWARVPHVTQFDRADITQLEQMRRRFNARPESEGRKLSLTAIVVKMAAAALRQFPRFNASLDLARDEIVYKRYVHVGVAVDTERGLLVPVIRDADRSGLMQIAASLNDLAERTRAKKVKPDELRGATFTVSNLGGLGTTYFSPIVNWPEVAILGVGRAETLAVHHDGQFEPRLVLPLSVSYDHRLIDGADAARFLRWLAEALEQPLLLLLEDGP